MIDFTTALGRLLQDGRLRDIFATDPDAALAGLKLSDADRAALRALDSAGLEIQADILLRKRFDLVARRCPQTCVNAWLEFRAYGREHWPEGEMSDTLGFCKHLGANRVFPCEWNRLRFAAGKSLLALHWTRSAPSSAPGLQVLIRFGSRWREIFFSFRL